MASSRIYVVAKCMLIVQLMILIAKSSQALLCLPCDESKCEEPKHCSGAVVLGICGCCSVCAKQKNESCGGVYGLYGTCDRGLRCVIRPPMNGGSITQYEVGVCEEENWDDDQLLGFEPCNENLIMGCNIINGKCECDSIRTCSNPFEFPSQEICQSALKRIEVAIVWRHDFLREETWCFSCLGLQSVKDCSSGKHLTREMNFEDYQDTKKESGCGSLLSTTGHGANL